MTTVLTVALAGTLEAATADYVCDGTADDVEINAAIQQLATSGGGTLSFAAGIYNTTRPIIVDQSNIELIGAANHGTVIRPAADWVSIILAGGAQATGVITFSGVSNFAARNFIVESLTLPMNGIIAIPSGNLATGTISDHGLFDNNIVKMAQAHTYSIWSLLSTDMIVSNNVIDGGATNENAHFSQEGIEIFGGSNVLISNNNVSNMGNAAINIVTISDTVNNSDVNNVTICNNVIDFSRIAISFNTSYSATNGADNVQNVFVYNNTSTNIFEIGLFIEIELSQMPSATELNRASCVRRLVWGQ